MTLDHSVIEELLAIDALGGLDAGDRATLERERAAHGECAECAHLEAGFAETAGRLAFALSPEPVDDEIVERILADSRPASNDAGIAMPAGEDARETIGTLPPGTDELAARRERRGRRWQVVVAAAAVAAVVVIAIGALRPSDTTSVSASAAQRVVSFSGTGEGTLAMAYTPGEPGAVFWGSLPDPAPGNVYEIWMIEGDQAIPGGCVTPTDGVVALHVDADIGTTELMAVTEEPEECPDAPTSEPTLIADLTIA